MNVIKFSEVQKAVLKYYYDKGYKLKDLAKHNNCSVYKIRTVLKSMNVKMRGRGGISGSRKFTPPTQYVIRQKYERGVPIKQLTEEYVTCVSTIENAIVSAGGRIVRRAKNPADAVKRTQIKCDLGMPKKIWF